jgi:hypothetical protein
MNRTVYLSFCDVHWIVRFYRLVERQAGRSTAHVAPFFKPAEPT